MKLKKIAALLAVAGLSAPAFATNGMNMEGYGPIATGMGGASMAYDNGNAGLINNPATLTLIKSGTSRFAVALGGLGPDIDSSMPGASKHSDGKGYLMPAVGYTRKDGGITWGIGMMAQGGMGTEYGTSSFISGYSSMIYGATSGVAGTTGASGKEARTELGIGRVMLPLGFDVTENFNIAGTLDYLWGGLDMRQPVAGSVFATMLAGGQASGTMVTGLMGVVHNLAGGGCAAGGVAALGGNCVNDVDYAGFDFSEGTNKMKQQATTTGSAFNLGFTYKATPQLAFGGVYHGKTNLKDMTGSGKMHMQVKVGPNTGAAGNLGTGAVTPMTVNGNFKVIDFQWPETYGFGLSYQPNSQWQIAADYKLIRWSDTMKNFRLQFNAADGMFAGTTLNVSMPLNWVDQDVFQIGAAYKMSDMTTLRFGANLGNNPVTARFMNPLFPAIITHQYTGGLGFAVSKDSNVDLSLTYAPENSVKNASNITTSHSQINWQAMFTRRF